MNKAVLYVAIAIVLGTITMVAPIRILEPSFHNLDGEARTYQKQEALERAVSPSNLSSTGLMLVPSFLLALCASLYIRKQMFYS